MIVGISGKIGSGKDTVGKIIQYLTLKGEYYHETYEIIEGLNFNSNTPNYMTWQIHKYADALKDIVYILTGCTRKQLEDINFKNSKLPDKWQDIEHCDVPHSDITTYRELLQYLGTDLLRNQLHENVWVNALMNKYYITHYIYADTKYVLQPNGTYRLNDLNHSGMSEQDMINLKATKINGCNWIITDVRFLNEANAIKERGGINIRVSRESDKPAINDLHPSETSLDNYSFDEYIDNNGTIEELIVKVKEILIKHKIL